MRVRFAPSPTGQLHIGGARTALYNWLAARHDDGTLVLRIEDTDRERSTQENTDQILQGLKWLGLDWDEGPVSQADHEPRHREVVEQLLSSGQAYRTTATADDVRAFKDRHGDDRGFRGEDEQEGAVRLRVPDDGEIVIDDLIRGTTTFQNVHLDDPVIARADGSPLYNLAVAVDDLDAGITDVIRGVDHLSNTQKQVLILKAMGETPPRYAHLSLLHGPDGKKLSKRHGAESVQDLRDKGYLPEAVRNYLALLGWGDADDQTIIPTDELIKRFDLSTVTQAPAQFDEAKLRWINGRYLHELSHDRLTAEVEQFVGRDGLGPAVAIAGEKIQTLAEFWPLCGFIWDGPADDPDAREKWLGQLNRPALLAAREALAALSDWTVGSIEQALRGVVDAQSAKPNAVFQPVRVALAGTTVSPGIFETLELLGREESLKRLDDAIG